MTSSSRSQPVSALLGADFSALVSAVADYDAAVAECPIDHPNIVIRTAARRGDCPRCGASSAGPCWLDVRAAGEVVRKLRKTISDGALGRQDGPVSSPGMNPDLPAPTQQGSDT